MMFAHAPKLVLAGSYSAVRPVADRAAALGAEVVLLAHDVSMPLGDVVGFDWAVVAVDHTSPAPEQLDRAVELLAGGLRRGALVVVASARPVASAARRFAEDLARVTGLPVGEAFAVAACESGAIAWAVDALAVDEATHLVSRIGTPAVDASAAPCPV